MKVLLVQDVEKLGSAGDIKEVSGGYGRNYLIPQKLAVYATPGLIKQAEEKLAKLRKVEAKQRETLRGLSERINGVSLRFEAKVGEQDRLYGSVTSGDIAERLSQAIGEEVDRRKIELGEPIKRVGLYSIAVRLMAGVEPRINVIVEPEGGTAAAFTPAETADVATIADSETEAALEDASEA
ncbi:MAG: 50S ribosomal protein L9 [Herpetosiphonaceae bacterium]|nr:50S ribosomal protein L9 [Herpetosiphonaceae bacterium]